MKLLGTICLLLGIGLFSTVEICQKLIVQGCGCHIDPYIMVFVRFIITGLILLAVGLPLLWRKGKHLAFADWLHFTLNGILGITLCLSLFHLGIDKFQNASSAAVVFSANSIFVVILARFINAEKWALNKWIAVLFGLIGISMFIYENGSPDMTTLKAIGVMSFSALLFALSVCYTKKTIAKTGAMVYMGGSSLIGGLLALPMFFIISDLSFGAAIAPMKDAIFEMSYMVFIATALAYCLYYTGISCTSAFHASMAFMLKPVLACVFSQLANVCGILSSERAMNAWTITGTVLIVVAMCLAQLCKAKK